MDYKGNKYNLITVEGEYYTLLRIHKTRKGWEVLDFETNFDLNSSSQVSLSQLKQKAREKKWLNEPCYFVLPRHEITSRIITLPSHDINEIKNMVALSAEEFVPYSLEEIQVSQCILEKLPNSESRVFVAIAHRDLIQEKINALQEMGWEPSGILVSTGLIVNTMSEIIKAKTKRTGYIGFVHLALGGIEVAIFNNNTLQFSRGVRTTWEVGETTANAISPKPMQPEPPEIETVLDPFRTSLETVEPAQSPEKGQEEISTDLTHEILREIRTSLNTYQRETETEIDIDTIYISSDFNVNAKLKDDLEKFLDIPCAFISLNDFKDVQTAEAIKPPISVPLFGIGISLSQGEPFSLNLLPEKLLETHKVRQLATHIKRCAVLILLLILALICLFVESVHQRQQLVRELEQQVAELEPNARGVAEKRQQLQILRREVAKSGSVLDYLARITEAAPPRLNINMVSYRRLEGINIWGRAKTIDIIHTFAENLRRQATASALNAFQQARSVYEQQTREQNEIIFDYQISIPFIEEEEVSGSDTTSNP
ncbi:MAG TPA: hypothetical protein PLX23_00090 [Candidatus Hydrogenedens sp.]|nr:hypothetical protein [Candidatus Hydrogenedens sp.]